MYICQGQAVSRLEYSSAVLSLSPIQVRESVLNRAFVCDSQHLDVWLLSVRMDILEREIYEGVLSQDERTRCGRFMFESDRVRCITARGGLRWLLSSYCGIPPEELGIQAGDYGKPALRDSRVPAQFNVSHSGDYILIGITAGAQCGVDIERSTAHRSEQAIADRFFCSREAEWLRRTENGFLRLWTTKEAIIKAIGRGLSIPLSDVDVTDVVEGKTSVITLRTIEPAPQTLWLKELNLMNDYTAAVAVIGAERSIRLMPA